LAKEIKYPDHIMLNSPKGSQKLLYIFDLGSVQNNSFDRHFNLSKVILQLYKKANFTTKECSKATLQTKVLHVNGEDELTGIAHPVDMSNGRDWEELNLTVQFRLLWPIQDWGKLVHIIITLQSQCDNKELPIKLYDLKSISKMKLRRKFYSYQPVLCLYLNDDIIEELVRNGDQHLPSDKVLSMSLKNKNPKRGTSRSDCRRVEYVISFEKLNIPFIISPLEYDSGKCIGTCDLQYFAKVNKECKYFKTNNYAKLLGAQAYIENNPQLTLCFSPGEYDPLMLLIASRDILGSVQNISQNQLIHPVAIQVSVMIAISLIYFCCKSYVATIKHRESIIHFIFQIYIS